MLLNSVCLRVLLDLPLSSQTHTKYVDCFCNRSALKTAYNLMIVADVGNSY